MNDSPAPAPTPPVAAPSRWLLLRGLSREQGHWGAFPPILAERVAPATVHCIDLPGTGTEFARPSPMTIAAIVEDTRARYLADLRGPSSSAERWGLLGISLGGMVAMGWAAAHPEDYTHVVLANTSAANLSAPWRRLDLRALPGVVHALLTRDELARHRRVLGLTTCLPHDTEAIAAAWAELQRRHPVRRATVLRQLWAASRFLAPPRLAPRVLVLSGGRDPFTDPACPRRLATHFGATLAVHPEAGHDLGIDAPEWMAEQVADWVGGAGA